MSDAPTLIWNDYTRNWCERKLRILRQIAELQLDVKELDIEGKAQGLNVPPLNKWLKAQLADELAANDGKSAKKIEKLVRDTQDQVLYGERLGHDVGIIPDNEKAEHLNGSKETHSAGGVTSPSLPADKGRALPPEPAPSPTSARVAQSVEQTAHNGSGDGSIPSARSTGSENTSCLSMSPATGEQQCNTTGVTAGRDRQPDSQQPEHEGTAKVAKAANAGGDDVTASKAGGSPDQSRPFSPPSAPSYEDPDLPPFLDRRTHV